jgi:hypothetical protein
MASHLQVEAEVLSATDTLRPGNLLLVFVAQSESKTGKVLQALG